MRYTLPDNYQAGEEAPEGGGTFFKILPPFLGAAQMFLNGQRVRGTLLRAKDPRVRSLSREVDLILEDMGREIIATEYATAELADKAAKKHLRETAKRPENKDGGGSLEDSIQSRPIRMRYPTGAVGVGDMDELDRTEYWRAQEFGSEHLVGRFLRGYFMPGQVAPDRGMFREHPAFTGGSYEGGGGAEIKRPIEARRFLTTGAGEAEVFRQRKMREIAIKADARLRAVLVQLEALNSRQVVPAKRPSRR